jgi:hypothetical protein
MAFVARSQRGRPMLSPHSFGDPACLHWAGHWLSAERRESSCIGRAPQRMMEVLPHSDRPPASYQAWIRERLAEWPHP